MSDSDQVHRLAIVGKPMTFMLPDKQLPMNQEDVRLVTVAAVNAARETGTAMLLFTFGSVSERAYKDAARDLDSDWRFQLLDRTLVVLSLYPGEIDLDIFFSPYEGKKTTFEARIDVFCVDHPSQRERKMRAAAESAKK